MRAAFAPSLAVLLVALALGGAARAASDKRTPNDAAKKEGLELLRSLAADFDGDGKSETLGVCEGQRGLRLCVFGENDAGAILKESLPWAGGTKLKDFEAKELNPKLPGQEIILELYDETPDEKVKRVRVYSGYPKPREIFTSVIFRPKNESERAEWEQDDVVKYGDARAGWYFWDEDGDGVSEIFVRRRAQLIKVPRRDGAARLLTGVREAVYAWADDARGGAYKEIEKDRFRDFLPALEIARTTGSAAWVPPKQLENLQSEALAKAVYAATDGKPVKSDIKIDFSPFFAHATDKDLATAWIENEKGHGDGEWIEIELSEVAPIHMVRVVGGCAEDKRSFRQHNVPERFELRFDTGERALVDLKDPKRPDRPAVAILQIPVKDRPFAKQALVFFDGKVRSKKVRLTLDAVKRQGRANRTCISEVSVH